MLCDRQNTSDKQASSKEFYGGKWNPYIQNISAVPEEHGTSHFCTVDKDRNAVSMTSTINGVFGSFLVSPSTGILLNNQMADFSDANTTSDVTPIHARKSYMVI